MARKPGTSLVKARLVIMEPPARVGAKPGAKLGTVQFQFNPSTLALAKNTEWRRKPSRMAGQTSLPEFVGSGPRTLSVNVFLDATAKHDNSVEERVEKLMMACVPTKKSIQKKKPASPWVRFEWGTAKSVSFDGVLSSLSVDYSLFDVDGRPLRATCSLSIEEAGVDTPGQNPDIRFPRSTPDTPGGRRGQPAAARLARVRRRHGVAGHRRGQRNRRPDGARSRRGAAGAGCRGRRR